MSLVNGFVNVSLAHHLNPSWPPAEKTLPVQRLMNANAAVLTAGTVSNFKCLTPEHFLTGTPNLSVVAYGSTSPKASGADVLSGE